MNDKKINYTYLFTDFKPVSITEAMKEDIKKNPGKYTGCPVRIREGMFYTDEELDKYIEDSLKRKLPDEKKSNSFVKIKSRFRKIK